MNYKFILFKWNPISVKWDQQEETQLTEEKFYELANKLSSMSEILKESANFFFRYDFMKHDKHYSTFYSFSPNKFD